MPSCLAQAAELLRALYSVSGQAKPDATSRVTVYSGPSRRVAGVRRRLGHPSPLLPVYNGIVSSGTLRVNLVGPCRVFAQRGRHRASVKYLVVLISLKATNNSVTMM